MPANQRSSTSGSLPLAVTGAVRSGRAAPVPHLAFDRAVTEKYDRGHRPDSEAGRRPLPCALPPDFRQGLAACFMIDSRIPSTSRASGSSDFVPNWPMRKVGLMVWRRTFPFPEG